MSESFNKTIWSSRLYYTVEFGEIFVKPQLTGDDGYASLSRFTLVGHGQDYSHHYGDGRGDAIYGYA